MQRGSNNNRQTNPNHRRSQGAAQVSDTSGSRGSGPSGHRQMSETAEVDHVAKQLKSTTIQDYRRESNSAPGRVDKMPHVTPGPVNNVQNSEGRMPKQWGSPSSIDQSGVDRSTLYSTPSDRCSPSPFSCMPTSNSSNGKEASPSVHSGFQDGLFPQDVQGGKSASGSKYKGDHVNLDDQHKVVPFDICMKGSGNVVKLKTSLLNKNRAMRKERKRQESGQNIQILRPGMVLLKGHLPLTDQVKLVKACRDLGLGSGGFYQPGYRDGANLHLKMMCLGKNWDPETSLYNDVRLVDGSMPPPIPNDFHRIVTGVIRECHEYLKLEPGVGNPEVVLPSMSPNICIVNSYSKTGKLGLHQDKDESPESLRRGLPVVSFSVGDTAEFLYGDERDIFKAEKVSLESGDVLIFGGKSRHIFHGVASIIPDTTPQALIDETRLKPGRLNLTFREY